MPGHSDCKGNSYQAWLDYGVIGFDDGLGTYFLQLDIDDYPTWWFGNTSREIESPYQLLAIIARLFDVETSIEYSKEMVDALIKDRADDAERLYETDQLKSVIGHYRVRDDYWGKHCGAFKIDADEDASIFPTPASLKDSYLEQAYKPYGDDE